MEQNRNQELSEQEAKIIAFVRRIKDGEIRIAVKAGKPIRIEEIERSILL